MDNTGATEPVGEAWQYDPEYHRMSDFLGVDKYERDDFEMAKKVSFLKDWGGEGAYNKISDLRKSLGLNTQGKTLIDQLFQHVRLQLDKQRTQPVRSQAPQPQKQTPIQKIVSSKVQNTVNKTVSQAVQNAVQQSISQTVNNTVKQAVADTIKKTTTDKKFIGNMVQEALKGAIK